MSSSSSSYSSYSSYSEDSSFSLSSSSCRQFSLDEIKKGTNNFDEKKVLGHGGEAKVYLAEIYLESQTERSKVAVKRLNKNSTEFEKEIRIVSKIKHSNLVALLGYCNESDEKILIYEYMEKGNLSDYVKMNSVVCLSWKQRLNICLGAAYGLQHLHKKTDEFRKGIIHRDVKPANILLDQNWVAKVSDFGMFKMSNAVQFNSTIITDIKGTRGYFAPEYIMSNHITRKIDVYAFGVVMFEVLCLKKPWDHGDESFYIEESQDLRVWAREVIDSKIKEDISYDCLKVFTDTIGRSLQTDRHKRPTMDEVVVALETALKCQELEDERILNIVLKAHRNCWGATQSPTSAIEETIASRLNLSMEEKTHDESLDIARSTRDVPPAHYTMEIQSFSQLLENLSTPSGSENYESAIFEVSGYKWKLSLYPNGKKGKNGEGHISLYLVIAETESLPVGWEVKVNFTMFVFDQLHENYTIIQDKNGKLHSFDKSKTEFGFAKLLPLNDFNDPSNGFLTRDKCVFGVEVFVWNKSGRGECLSSKQKVEATHTWKIENFASLEKKSLESDEFILANRTWAIQIYPKGDVISNGEFLSLYLKLKDSHMKGKAYVNYKMRIMDQLHGNHKESESKKWFEDQLGWGLSAFMKLSDLHNASMGFLVEDTLIIEFDILPIWCANKLISPN